MYANAEQATAGLRYNGTGKVLNSKIVARNTKLLWFSEELIGLKLHQTVIATFHADGVRFDTRGPGSPHGQGWFTNVTIQRLEDFTPARFLRDRGLLYVVPKPDYSLPNWTSQARLYAHGCTLSCNGSFENSLAPLVERHIADTHHKWPRRAKSMAKKIAKHWREGGKMLSCCEDDDSDAHMISHVEKGQSFLPWFAINFTALGHERNLVGDKLIEGVEEMVRERLIDLRDVAIHNAAPTFPYPQNPKTNRRR